MFNRDLPLTRHKKRRSGFTQPLRVESLEDRRLLATFTVTNLNDAGAGSLREAVSLANSNSGADEIVFSETVAGTIELTSGELEVTEGLTITGPARVTGPFRPVLTLDAGHNSRLINFTASTGDLTIGELTLANGQTSEDAIDFDDTSQNGGAIRFVSSGVLTLTESGITDSRTLGEHAGGGGIFADSGTINLVDSSVTNSLTVGTSADGGGILSGSGQLTLTNSSVSSNRTAGNGSNGGGIQSADGAISLSDSRITSNRATGGGGGISLDSGSIVATESSYITRNMSATGGGIYAGSRSEVSITFDSSRISENSAQYSGGGISVGNATIKLTESALSDNRAVGAYSSGGGIGISSGSLTLENSEVLGNQTNRSGGGISTGRADILIVDSTIGNNSAFGDGSGGTGGGISTGGDVEIIRSTLVGNFAGIGGALFSRDGDLNLVRSTISGNIALRSGGGLYGNGEFLIDGSTITDNTAVEVGGGIDGRSINTSYQAAITIRNSIIANNSDNGTAPDFAPSAVVQPDVSYSLIGNNTGTGLLAAPVGSPDANGNLVGSSDSPIDPLLGELTFNGGPTRTHLLLPGSPAIDAGDQLTESSSDDFSPDQRGLGVVIDGDGDGTRTLDIGAVELNLVSPVALSVIRDEGGTLARPDLLSRISITFDDAIRIIDVDDLVVRNDTLDGVVVDTSALQFSYQIREQTANWDFINLTLEPGFYSFELSDSITSFAGASLDGDFDGTPGGNFVESVYVALPGDANLDGQVDVLGDAFALVENLGTTQGATWAQGDFNGDGAVDVLNDAFALVANLGRSVIPQEPVPPPATSQLSIASSNTADSTPSLQRVVLVSGIETIDPKEQQADQKVEKLLASSTPAALAGSLELDAAFEANGLFEDSLF